MSDECKILDPTAFGLFFVAIVSLPLAISGIGGYFDSSVSVALGPLFMAASFMIFIAAIAAYRAGSNFGFIVFGLVALGVFLSGVSGGTDQYVNITLGIIYLVALIWSYRVGNPKTLTLILLTTALIFLFLGIGGFADSAVCSQLLMGIAALANFVLTLSWRLPWPTRSSPATDAKASLAELKPLTFPLFKIINICCVMTRSS